ncbi:peptidyl-tRNA hydrolase [secondary endosymbiont of Heteropsylla cubana]|uniref:Peptidyl-tRNA hydrolase n=1 Tax=secondary endosymbiont of Heteropsylla cubana TaxID=134287 RepID=J3VTU1_9ENTR|nr:aminoacyl-tRNA hydrolase [secondary endosymbiont of Heteropsylla cubana]AFP85431.1 peptidyl-tRNA hydrolase [secondary endosymbiont of Heteropsylla cubana]
MTIKLIVGLSNPQDIYKTTRHNAGAWYLELLAKQYGKTLKKEKKFYGYTTQITLINQNIRLLLPTTFMNLSGKSVAAIARFYHIDPEYILVAHDELDLLPGRASLKLGGSHNGHNGIKDIISSLNGNNLFYRLRIGIGRPDQKNKVIRFVLEKPPKLERQIINGVIDEAIICTKILILQNLMKAMNRLHAYRPLLISSR